MSLPGAGVGQRAAIGVHGGTPLDRVDQLSRDFHPHVTLARMRRARHGAVARFLAENGDLRLEPFQVTRFVLLSARPGSGGPPYAVEAAYPLD